MKKLILILAALTCACSWAGVASARLGALGRNDTVVTNVTDVTPGNYATVSNRAMTASTYTDSALGAFASTGAVKRAELHGTPTRWTDATGCVWEVARNAGWSLSSYTGFTPEEISSWVGPYWHVADEEMYTTDGWFLEPGGTPTYLGGDPNATTLHFSMGDEFVANWTRYDILVTNLVGRTALTNDIPRTAGDVGAYPAASGSALESGKQDRLPYPTNAIPFSVIDGAPSGGGQEWRVDTQSSYNVHYVTNGMADVSMDAELSCSTNGWPNGASMFARFTIGAGISYMVMDDRIRLVGYGTWPTNSFQSVWWRSGTNIYVNVILEE